MTVAGGLPVSARQAYMPGQPMPLCVGQSRLLETSRRANAKIHILERWYGYRIGEVAREAAVRGH